MAEDDKTQIETIEIGDKKYTVTPEFKQVYNDHVGKVSSENKTLKEKLEDMQNKVNTPAKKEPHDDTNDDDDRITFDALADDPEGALNKFLKKHGYQSSDPEKIKQELRGERALEKYWDSFYTEHKVFDREKDHDVVELVAKKHYQEIKDLTPKESRKKIAEWVAEKFGKSLKDMTPEERKTANQHPGIVLESGDVMLDSSKKKDDTTDKDLTMSELLKRRRKDRRQARTANRS